MDSRIMHCINEVRSFYYNIRNIKKDQENAIDNDNYTHYNVFKFQF